MHERLRDALLGRWGHAVAARPRTTLAICLILAAGCLVLTAMQLEFRPDRSDLIDPELSWNKRYTRYKERFDRWDDVIVCLEGDAGDERIDDLARSIAAALRADPRVSEADAGFDAAEVGPSLLSVAPEPLFTELLERMRVARVISAATNANQALAGALAPLQAESDDPDALDRLEELIDPYMQALEGGRPDFSFLEPRRAGWRPLMSEVGSGRIRFVQVQFAGAKTNLDDGAASIGWLRDQIGRMVAAHDDLAVDWGVTGIMPIEADETVQSMRDSTVASVVAFVLITALMCTVFRGVRVPLIAAGSLLIGIAWSFGWLILSVGHLQLLSVIFSVILLGLGVDFALHLVARLELVQQEHDALPSAVARVFRGIGPGMLTGAITTAAAFGATTLTKFRGMAEMGIIASGGILLCLVAMLSAFPAGVALAGDWKKTIRPRVGGERAHFAHGRLDAVDFRPWRTISIAGACVALMAIAAMQVQYDPNILNLHPPGIESVVWEKRLVEDDARSVWCAMIETTPAAAPALVDRLTALDTVSSVGGMGLLLPADREQRAERIAVVRAADALAPRAEPGMTVLRSQLAAISFGLQQRARSLSPEAAAPLVALEHRIEAGLRASFAGSDDERARRWSELDASFRSARDALGAWVTAALDARPPTPADLPEVLRQQWTAGPDEQGAESWLLRIYPTIDPGGRSVLHPQRLGPFVRSLEATAPAVFGPAVQIYRSSVLIVSEYTKAAAYAIAAILVVLLLDFRSVADALCSMLPVCVGFIGVFGMMGVAGVPLNFANIIVMPLIFGIGVDAGVHMVHRWRDEPFGRPAGLSGGTGRGITLTMLTTIIGFGCMLLAQHRGIRSLGFVMVCGLAITLLACYSVLPAVLRLRTRRPG